ncbi:MAG: hypothetical protein ACTSX9_02835 [Candidatus Njordarchaeales archaeon]
MIDETIYYAKPFVRQEIYEFSKNRWVAIHCKAKDKSGRQVLIRYLKNKPLVINKPEDIGVIMNRFRALKPRTFYATANIYKDLSTKDKVLDYYNNVIAKTPTWDIDSSIEQWDWTLKVGEIIVEALAREGVTESVYLKWSGNGLHIHIHEKAFSNNVYAEIKPLDLAYAVVEYILKKFRKDIEKISERAPKPIKVENLMDPQRVFTAPMSLHRELDVVCVAFKPDEMGDFNLSWVDPRKPRHNPNWRKFVEGEADELARKAFKEIGPYTIKSESVKLREIEERIQEVIESAKKEQPKPVQALDFSLEQLKFNPTPPPIQGGREFSKGPIEAFLKIEDILSHFALGNISLDHAIRALNYARFAIIPYQKYPKEAIEKLDKLYDEAVKLLVKLRTPERVKQWLEQRGYRKVVKRLDEFFK